MMKTKAARDQKFCFAKFLVRLAGIGASAIGRSRPSALLTSANILGGLFLASLGAKLHSIPAQ